MKFLLPLMILLMMPLSLAARVPSLNEVHERTLRVAGYDPDEIRDWRRKARWAAALPKFQVGFDRDLKDVVGLTTQDNISISGGDITIGPDENRFDQDFQQGTSFEVKAVWYLDEIVFSRDRLEVSRETRNWLEDRSRLLERVTELYFAWKREKNRSRREEWAGKLDGYTGGWFSGEFERNEE